MQKPSLGENKHWALVLDEYTKYKWPIFMKNKSELSQNNSIIIPILQSKI